MSLGGIRQFGRRVAVIVGKPGTPGFRFEGLRTQFSITKTDSKKPSKAKVQIYNLSPTSRSLLETDGAVVFVLAGYGDPDLVFRGDIDDVKVEPDGRDIIATIEAADGRLVYQSGSLFQSYTPPLDSIALLRRLAAAMPIEIGNIPSNLPSIDYPQGYSVAGPVRDAIDEVVTDMGAIWSIQDGELIVTLVGQGTPDQAFKVNAQTGLVGSPEKTKRGIKFTMRTLDRLALLWYAFETGTPRSPERADWPDRYRFMEATTRITRNEIYGHISISGSEATSSPICNIFVKFSLGFPNISAVIGHSDQFRLRQGTVALRSLPDTSQSVHVVDEVAENDHGSVACETDAALMRPAQRRGDSAEDVLHPRSDAALGAIGCTLLIAQRTVPPVGRDGPVLDPHFPQSSSRGFAVIGAIAIQTSVSFLDQIEEDLRIVDIGRRDGARLDQLGALVDLGVVLVAEVPPAVLAGPPCIGVLLPQFGLIAGALPVLGNIAVFDHVVLLARIPLHRDLHDGSVNDLAALQSDPLGSDLVEESFKARREHVDVDERLLEAPDRVLVREATADVHAQEAMPRQTLHHR